MKYYPHKICEVVTMGLPELMGPDVVATTESPIVTPLVVSKMVLQ